MINCQMYCSDISKKLTEKKKSLKIFEGNLIESKKIMREIEELTEVSYEMDLSCNLSKNKNCDCCKDLYEKIFGDSESCWEKLNNIKKK